MISFVVAFLVLAGAIGLPVVAADLPQCQADLEVTFFNAQIDVKLPPGCSNIRHLLDIGFLISDAVAESFDPAFDEEKMRTTVCPFPDEIDVDGVATYRYQATGRGERCPSTGPPRSLQMNSPCSVAEQIGKLQEQVERDVIASRSILLRMRERVGSEVMEDVDLQSVVRRASEGAEKCKGASLAVHKAATVANMLCAENEQNSTDTSFLRAEIELDMVMIAATRAKRALSQTRQAQHEVDVLYHIEISRSRRRHLEETTCAYADDAELDRKRAEEAVKKARSILQTLENTDDYKEAEDIVDDAEDELKHCESKTNKMKAFCSKGISRGDDVYRLKDARKEADKIRKSADAAETLLVEIQEFEVSNVTDPPTASPTVSPTANPTASPTSSPTSGPVEAPTEAPISAPTASPTADSTGAAVKNEPGMLQQDYISRLEANLNSSNTQCEEVARAVQQKTFAEEALLASHVVFDEITALSAGFIGNYDVNRIRVDAFLYAIMVQDGSAKASAAALATSELCSQGQLELLSDELKLAIAATNQTRLALADLKMSRDAMEETVALISFDPTLSELLPTDETRDIALLQHLGAVETEVAAVDSQMNEVPDSALVLPSLGRKRESLVKEEMEVEAVLTSDNTFPISKSALKKDEYYQTKAPDFDEVPPLQLLARSRQPDDNIGRTATRPLSREEWLSNFFDSLATGALLRVLNGYKLSQGGCVEDSEVLVTVHVTEVATVWEQFDPTQCSTAFLGRPTLRGDDERQERDPSLESSTITSPTTSPTSAPVDPTPAPVDPTPAPIDPTPAPVDPTPAPVDPTPAPVDPTPAPVDPTPDPTKSPTAEPTLSPTVGATASPTTNPTISPTSKPSASPSADPTENPTKSPTAEPTLSPTDAPTATPSDNPTSSPTANPTAVPTKTPSELPTVPPTKTPTAGPTEVPTESPTISPTKAPTAGPTASPTKSPTMSPTDATLSASVNASPVTLTRTTLQDAYVRDGRSIDRTLGATDPIKLDVKLTNRDDANRRSFLQFDLSGIDGVVTQAKILLKVYGARDVPVVHNLHAVSDNSWDEQKITWNTMPSLGPVLDTVTVPIEPVAEGNYMQYNVTTHVNDLVAQKQSLASFAVAADPKKSVDLLIKYYSKEAGPNDQPIFEVTFDPSASPKQTVNGVTKIETPVEAAYTRDGRYADKNFGKSDRDRIFVKNGADPDYNRIAYLKMDLRGFHDTVSRAILSLKVYSTNKATPVVNYLHAVDSTAWTEDEITWDNQPGLGEVVASRTIFVDDASNHEFIDFDVTSYINDLISLDEQLASLAIVSGEHDVWLVYYSIGADSSDRPKFEVTYTPLE